MVELQDLSRGISVNVAQINRSLKALWKQEGNVVTRASSVNFAVYSEAADALNFNTHLMAEITREHACRVILLVANPLASNQRVQAWISAHCHVTHAGARQVCSEQIAFLLEKSGPDVVRNILFSHLDSDLPLYLWWQEQFSDQIDRQLWNWVDRLFFDSYVWGEPVRQMELLRESVATSRSRTVLCDLNWRRLIYVRLTVAQFFDHPWVLEQKNAIRTVEISHDPAFWTTATLLISWLASRFGWKLEEKRNSEYRFKSAGHGSEVTVKLTALSGPTIGQVKINFNEGKLNVVWVGDFLEATLINEQKIKQMFPAGGTSPANLVNEELMRGGEHRTYLDALKIAKGLWEI
jgi:glucose-6-phosphate dehydrogenase assembly protein OpcA